MSDSTRPTELRVDVRGVFEAVRALAATVDHSLGKFPAVTVTLRHEVESMDPASVVGKPAQIEITSASGSKHLTIGEVQSAEIQDWGDGGWTIMLQIVGGPLAAILNRSARTYCDRTAPDIIKEVLQTHAGVALKSDLLKHTYPTRPYTVQYFESDLDFVNRLAIESGLSLVFDSSSYPAKYNLYDDAYDFEGYQTMPFSGRAAAQNVDLREEIVRMGIGIAATPRQYTVDSFDFRTPRKRLAAEIDGWHKAESGGQRADVDIPYLEPAEGDSIAAQLATLDGARTTFIEAESNSSDLRCGLKFELEEHPDPAMNQTYYVTASTTRWTAAEEHSTGGSPGGGATTLRLQRRPDFAVRDFGAVQRPATRGLSIGNVTGIEVTGDSPKGSMGADSHGRVRVRFKWHGLSPRAGDTDRSAPMRVSQLWAGEKRGFHLLPRVGDEVIVDFENGDPDRPIIVGSLFNETNSPANLDNESAHLVIRSRTLPDGKASNYNELRFDDSGGKERVFLQAERDLLETIKNDVKIDIGNCGQVTAKSAYLIEVGGASLEIKPDSVVLKLGAARLAFDAAGQVVLNGQIIRIG